MIRRGAVWPSGLPFSRIYQFYLNAAAVVWICRHSVFAWQGPGMPKHKRTRMGDSSWPLTCSHVFIHSAVVVDHPPKSWTLECPFANQFFRLVGNAQKCRGPLPFWTFISSLVECMLEAWQEAQPWGDSEEGDRLLQGLLTPGSESHRLGHSAPSWCGLVKHFCATWGMEEEGCANILK